MLSLEPLSSSDLAKLTALFASEPKHQVRQRMQAILLGHQRYSVPEIGAILSVDARTVRQWFHSWKATGFSFFQDKPRSGRPTILTKEEKKKSLTM